ncbi:hypothetical protein DRV85_04440 [Rhodosalinus halophilus]|uniref:AAA+ family ATPase n=1 Tax=Rhodosalinus halophilus TaxID=2259333 RepID=A0A365UBZ9_9RHOB|nr:hypothetical protein [Rhodosalinus halophilus]RBI86819.1 hypothetical protein DRV85_04440 [Rhodosalinus halophilus]
MRAALLAVCLAAAPAAAQESAPETSEEEDGLSLMEEGARLFFRGIMSELDPALRELEGLTRELEPAVRDFAREMGPALRDLLGRVEDWSAYHPPEMLPNGDIIMRRKEPLEEPPAETEAPSGPVDL